MILLLLLGGSAISVQAQTTGSNSTNGPTHSSEGKTKKNKQKKAGLNHRRNYNWNTGQQATPTGQEATGVGSGYSSIRKDTSGKRDSSTNNQ
ncbi:hypothetical protein SAMN05444008_104129 [Cnuella takakiae]|uniref:Uncharacterized protein n=2 Tax=Cnuella takakiae TaxID=1302690 RepID=A0A1M4Y2W6_9BACT|nr:hypothetical protein SAMN05444008_104129 [Cnuella takakiae]